MSAAFVGSIARRKSEESTRAARRSPRLKEFHLLKDTRTDVDVGLLTTFPTFPPSTLITFRRSQESTWDLSTRSFIHGHARLKL
ncbi:hypothetical protein P5V15_006690 [Pogonomyrmex californicus]